MKIYLAGPEVFRADAVQFFDKMKRISTNYKIEAFSPFDNQGNAQSAMQIFRDNIQLINEVDVIVANISPFRGLSIDDGTAFEIGYAFALGKKILGYTPYFNQTYKDLAMKNEYLIDKAFPLLEDFNQPCNLMIIESIIKSGGGIYETFEKCLESIKTEMT